ncbi:MAG TPA: DAK2 domain-containing protein, partial [Gammaproteobacteria bacterium]|nr:DAK2 domain-containing protein [Gammaproteobacteria bacterium]
MSVHSVKIVYLDGTRLYSAIVAGIRQVISKQEYLNNINVFPVPDRDTGTNMALTLNAILEGTYSRRSTTIHELLDNVANAALNGARGNSGAILAQFFQGLSEGAKTVERTMTTQNFVAAI